MLSGTYYAHNYASIIGGSLSVIDCWGTNLDEGIPGAILSCYVVATRGFSRHNCVIKLNKQVEGKN